MKLSKQALIALGITGAGMLPDGALAQEHLDKMLAQVAETPSTSEMDPGAMCYEIAFPPARIDYVCPLCKSKTLHEKWENTERVEEMDRYRKQVKRIKELGADVALDETDFCSQCRRDKDSDKLNLYILVWTDKRALRTQLEENDLKKVIAFLEKKNVWNSSYNCTSEGCGCEKPLKDELPRIRKILGLGGGGTTSESGGLKP